MQPQPSSLVFVVIVGAWAAYLVPQWVRRRDLLGSSRGRDRNSERLRVLSRRRRASSGPSSQALLTAPEPPLPASTAAPAAARPAPAAARPAPTAARPAPTTARPATVAAARPVPAARRIPAPGAAARVPPSAVRPGLSQARRVAARRRARVLLVLVLATAASGAAAALTPLPAAVPGVVGALLGLDVVALLLSARARAAGRRRAGTTATAAATGPDSRRPDSRRPDSRRPDSRRPVRQHARAWAPGVSDRSAARTAAVRRTPAAPGPLRHRPAAAASPLAAEGTWTPVPVPPPTYTLKATAPRPLPRPLPDPDDRPTAPLWEPIPQRPWAATVPDPVEDLDLDVVLARRRAVNG